MMKMKKKLIMLLAMLACMSASAQVKFGAKVGLDLTNFWGKECGHHMVLNYQAGLLMEYKFHPHFGIPKTSASTSARKWVSTCIASTRWANTKPQIIKT